MCEISNITPEQLEEANETELRAIHRRRFKLSAGYVGRQELLRALRTGEPVAERDLLDKVKIDLMLLVEEYWEIARTAFTCNGICGLCPDGAVLECLVNNEQLLGGREMMPKKNTEDYKKMTWDDFKKEGYLDALGEQTTHMVLLRFCMAHRLFDASSSTSKKTEELLQIVKDHFGVKEEKKKKTKKTGQKKKDDTKKPAETSVNPVSLGQDSAELMKKLDKIGEGVTDLKMFVEEMDARLNEKIDWMVKFALVTDPEFRVGGPFEEKEESVPAKTEEEENEEGGDQGEAGDDGY